MIESTSTSAEISIENSSPTQESHSILILPSRGWPLPSLRELWANWELLYFLVWRDVKVRYKQTIFGVAWSVFQPLVTAIVFTLVFSYLVRIPTGETPYAIFSLTALVPWIYFARSLERVSNSVVDNAHLLRKVYFPRVAMPVSGVLSGLVDLGTSLVVLLGLMVVYRIAPTFGLIALPIFILLAMITALGAGLWAAALNVYYRDIKYVIPFVVLIWMYATPVIYPIELIPERFRMLYGLNPMVAVVEGFRWALLGHTYHLDLSVAISAMAAIGLLLTGALFFRRMEDAFADVV